jgi:hypothetical protein
LIELRARGLVFEPTNAYPVVAVTTHRCLISG